ncbi:MAG: hypothetical protein R6V50_08475 [Thermoplasmatota archaeon]
MNRNKKFAIYGLVISAVVLSTTLISVALTQNDVPPPLDDEQQDDGFIVGTGTIQYLELEGGFYGIVSDDSENYLPLTLPEEFEEDGLRVQFTLELLEDHFSIYMWGTVVEIIDIAEIE